MTVEETFLEIFQKLPPDKQQEVLDFAEFLLQKANRTMPREGCYGVLEHLNISISKEEIDEARREAWANFPREQFYE